MQKPSKNVQESFLNTKQVSLKKIDQIQKLGLVSNLEGGFQDPHTIPIIGSSGHGRFNHRLPIQQGCRVAYLFTPT